MKSCLFYFILLLIIFLFYLGVWVARDRALLMKQSMFPFFFHPHSSWLVKFEKLDLSPIILHKIPFYWILGNPQAQFSWLCCFVGVGELWSSVRCLFILYFMVLFYWYWFDSISGELYHQTSQEKSPAIENGGFDFRDGMWNLYMFGLS